MDVDKIDERLVSKTVVSRRWGSEKQKFCIKQVDKALISAVKR